MIARVYHIPTAYKKFGKGHFLTVEIWKTQRHL